MKARALFLGLAITAFGLSPASAATPNDDAAPSMMGGFVQGVVVGNSQASFVFLKNASGTGIPCSATQSSFKISKAHPGHENMYKTLLAAQLTREDVALQYETISGVCWVKSVVT